MIPFIRVQKFCAVRKSYSSVVMPVVRGLYEKSRQQVLCLAVRISALNAQCLQVILSCSPCEPHTYITTNEAVISRVDSTPHIPEERIGLSMPRPSSRPFLVASCQCWL